MDALIEQNSAELGSDITLKYEEAGQTLQVKMVKSKKKLIVSDLNLTNPEDRALSLCMKMVEMRKKREERQSKLIQEIRKSRVLDFTIGQIPKMIARDHFIARHEYLRETQYRSNQPKIIINRPMGGSLVVGEERKKALQREIEVLEKSKVSTHKYEIKRIVQEILNEAINYSIVMHERKKKFHLKNQSAVAGNLEKEWERRVKGKKGSLSLSRVLDLKMAPSDAESENQSENGEEEQKQRDASQESNQKDELSDLKSQLDEPQEDGSQDENEIDEEGEGQAQQSMSSNHE